MKYDLIVMGGGPAGMMSAITAGSEGMHTILTEKNNKLGKKLRITGKGRCNVTNYGDLEDFQRSIITNGKFLYSSLYAFDNLRLMELLESRGVKLKVEQGNRVFPVSDRAGDIIDALYRLLRQNKVEIRLNTAIQNILIEDNHVHGVVTCDNNMIKGDKVVIASGGMSWQQTGSTGDGYKLAQDAGHEIVKPRPALIPLEIKEPWVKDLQGLSLNNVYIRAVVEKRVIAEQSGEMLFTHFGISGPAVLSISSYLSKPSQRPINLQIDIKPELSAGGLDNRLQETLNKNNGKSLKNALHDLVPRRMVPVILQLSKVGSNKKVDRVSRQERERLVHIIKNIPLTLKKMRPLNEAIVTGGGVGIKEINPSTMESKIVKGLYFAGEIIDVDALTGGYNLQIAFSTGYLSGISAAGK
ncbi:MAG: NAD(P)/FAD-dependent oxidoreductase [Firmicutes bacterium]|nr:NAD(P)/FAD-dependent oxidoreductase [Bacillota bacterium]